MTYRLWMVAKSPPILDGGNPINHGINHLSTGAGFLPSTVLHITMFKFARDLNRIDFQRLPHMTNIAHWPDVFGNGQVGQVGQVFFFSWLSGHYRTVPYAVGLCWFAWATQSHVNEWKRDRNEGHRRTDRTKECGAKKKRRLSLFYEHIVLFVFLGDCHIHSVNPCKSCIYIYIMCVYIYTYNILYICVCISVFQYISVYISIHIYIYKYASVVVKTDFHIWGRRFQLPWRAVWNSDSVTMESTG